jgi:membrane protein implicated in regulation of membrane protease activity
MEWWVWILVGLLLLAGEIVTPGGFYVLFFGVGALIVGALAGLNAAGPAWLQVVLFSVLSLVTLLLFREKLLKLTQSETRQNIDSLIGETAIASEDIPINSIGKAELRGTSWNARNIGDKSLSRGERCKVERLEGLTIFVRTGEN